MTSRGFQLMQKYIQAQSGIAIGKDKAYLIESRLSGILSELGLSSFEQLYYQLENGGNAQMSERVIDAITTNETLWFRDKTPWQTLEDILLPQYIDEIRQGKRSKVRIWSAGCSTGQEAYSTLMCIDRYLSQRGIKDISLNHFEILATDISRDVLEKAKAGTYDKISIMRGLDSGYRDRYFTNEDKVWTLSKDMIDRVQFRQFNLQNSFIPLGVFDIVFCRYVTIYFSVQFRKRIFERIRDILVQPRGVLFLGNSEVFTDYEDKFIRQPHKGGVYYQVKERDL
ncbi:MAG TPA: protein-glutamate O-methyltransferase CheR [Clostridia bacterium]|nr:protein-glutamate O-methyltransferase CheR [Clostridia bacterium]